MPRYLPEVWRESVKYAKGAPLEPRIGTPGRIGETVMTLGRGLGQAVVLALALAVGGIAQEYSFRFYGAAEGLQNLVVLSLAQDGAGYIWAGTEVGLYRYDGAFFRLMGKGDGLPCSTEVHGLFVASDGALWANTCAKIFRFDGQRFLPVSGVGTLLRGAQVMADSGGGSILITTPDGVYEASRGADGAFSAHSDPLPKPLAGEPLHSILRQGKSLWFGCGRGLCLEEAGKVSAFGWKEGLPEDSWDGIRISLDGSVWVRSSKSIYRRARGQAMFSEERANIGTSGFWGALTLGRDGSIMVPTDRGLAIHTEAGWSVVNRQRGLRNEMTGAVLEDRDGSVWIGLIGGGVARWLGRGVWESWKTSQGLPSDVVWNIRRDRKGALWVGTSLGLTRLDRSGRTRTWARKDGLSGDNVRWLAETSDGSIWAAMKPGGLARIDPVSGRIRTIGPKDGVPCDPEDVHVDQHDRLWLPTGCGLFLNDRPSVSNRFIRVETPESFGHAAWKVMDDTQGIVWITNRTGLWSLREGQWRQHRRAEGLLTDSPYVMALAADGSIWLRHRYDAGIDRLEISGVRIVRATAVVPEDPKKPEGTAFHGFDAFGNFWRGSLNGVAVRRVDTWTTFTTEDGLVWNDCDGEAFWADSDGSVWLGTSGGLAHYSPGKGVPSGPLVAYPIIGRLEIIEPARLIRAEFSSLSYKAEQLVRFSYRLDGTPWTDSADRNISIGGLGPGRHRLEVRCRIRDGPFSPEIATAEFQVKPRWEETWWARLGAIACVLLVIIQVVRWRLGAAAQKQAELEAIVAARTANLSRANSALDEKARQLRYNEERLRASEARLKDAQRLAKIGSWERDIEADDIRWSNEMLRIFGLSGNPPSTLRAFLSYVHAKDREKILETDNKLRSSIVPLDVEYRIIRADGEMRFVRSIVETIRNDQGVAVRITGATQDITEQVRARELLRESEGHLKNAERLAHVGHWQWDLRTNRVSGSEELFRIFGKPENYTASFEGFLQTLVSQDRGRVDRAIRDSLVTKIGHSVEFQIVHPDAGLGTVSCTWEVLLDDEGVPVRLFGTCQDITDSRRAQEESFARQKLESVGTLASGIAHDFNNLLGGVLAQAELAQAECATGSYPEEELEGIRNVAIRGSDIVRQLMIYAGKESGVVELLDVSRIVTEMIELLKVLVSKRATLETDLGQDLPAVRGNVAQLRQIVMNLVTNASEAIGDRDGVIRVTTKRVEVGQDGSGVILDRLPEGDYLQLEVSDTGCGMSQEMQAMVFDPFFTTKSAGHGLGLAVVHGIVRGFRGTIRVASDPGRGTTFRILLPCTDTRASFPIEPLSGAWESARPSQAFTVLVVEDEDTLRQAVVKMLRNTGLEVLEAHDGPAAIDLLRAHGRKIDVILLDMTIPGASSNEVVAEAAQVRADITVILTSAYSQEMLTPAMSASQIRGFIRKPFQFGDLVNTLRNAFPRKVELPARQAPL
jgi:PAS domain S-box-containing protein